MANVRLAKVARMYDLDILLYKTAGDAKNSICFSRILHKPSWFMVKNMELFSCRCNINNLNRAFQKFCQ